MGSKRNSRVNTCVTAEESTDDGIDRLNIQVILNKAAYVYTPFMTKYLNE